MRRPKNALQFSIRTFTFYLIPMICVSLIPLIELSKSFSFGLIMLTTILIAVINTFGNNNLSVWLVTTVPTEFQGRVFHLLRTLLTSLVPIGTIACSAFLGLELWDLPLRISLYGILAVIIFLVTTILLPKWMKVDLLESELKSEEDVQSFEINSEMN